MPNMNSWEALLKERVEDSHIQTPGWLVPVDPKNVSKRVVL